MSAGEGWRASHYIVFRKRRHRRLLKVPIEKIKYVRAGWVAHQ